MLSMEKVGDHWKDFIGLILGVGGLDLVNLYVIQNWNESFFAHQKYSKEAEVLKWKDCYGGRGLTSLYY